MTVLKPDTLMLGFGALDFVQALTKASIKFSFKTEYYILLCCQQEHFSRLFYCVRIWPY